MKTYPLLLLTLFLTGCLSVNYVRNIGIRREHLTLLNQDSIYAAPDGTIACEVEATYMRPTVEFPMHEGLVTISKKKRYLIGSPAAFSNTVFHAYDSDKYTTNLYSLAYFPRIATNEPVWAVFPAGFYAPAPTMEELKTHLRTTALHPIPLPMDYQLNGRTVQFKLGLWQKGYLDSDVKRREIRAWWGYPCQILLVPALAIDILTVPIQFCLGVQEFNSHF